jgi:hypothetical protein
MIDYRCPACGNEANCNSARDATRMAVRVRKAMRSTQFTKRELKQIRKWAAASVASTIADRWARLVCCVAQIARAMA